VNVKVVEEKLLIYGPLESSLGDASRKRQTSEANKWYTLLLPARDVESSFNQNQIHAVYRR
jgi:hypothetical protein